MCNYNQTMQQVNLIDLKIVFSEDAKEWNKYLADCLTEAIESTSYQLRIVNERIENVQCSNKFIDDDQLKIPSSTLIIISPDFLTCVQQNNDLRNYFKQFKADRTICMLCGVKEIELTKQIKENLVQFNNWKCLIAKEQDNEFIYSVIDTISSILHANNKTHLDDIYSPYSFITSIRTKRPIPNYANEYKNLDSVRITDDDDQKEKKPIKPKFCKFELAPKKVRKGTNKVSILLNQPLDDKLNIKVTLEFKTPSKSNQKCKQELKEINVKKKNPYTLQLKIVADDLLIRAKVIRVNLFTEQNGQTNLLGIRLLKCETEKSENLIDNLSINCIAILKQSLGLSTIQELDLELAKRFKRTIPIEKLNNLLDDKLTEQKPIIKDLLTGDLTSDQLTIESNKSNKTVNETSLSNKSTTNKSVNKSTNQPKKHPIVKYVEHEHPTLLHFAAEYNLKAFASSLLEFEPNSELCFIKNCHGLTPLSIAKLNEFNEISRLIKKCIEKYFTDEETHLTEDQNELISDYVNMSTIKLPKSKNEEQTSDFTDSSDQSSIDGVDSVDGLIVKNQTNKSNRNQFVSDYDFIRKPIRLGKLIDLDSLSTGEENSSGDDKLIKPSKSTICPIMNDETKKENYDYDVVKTSPRRTNLIDSPIQNNHLSDKLPSSLNKPEDCKSNLFDRFNELRVSSSSSASDASDLVAVNNKPIDLQTSNLTESQIELLNIIKAFKMGCYTNDEMEAKFKQWAAKYKYKIDHNNRFETDSSLNNRMVKRSVSSSHLLSQDAKLESKDSGCSSRSSTIKTCLSNINLNAADSSTSKFYSTKQFSLTDWFHTLTAKLKQTKNDAKDDLAHKSPNFEKYEKKEKNVSPSKWTKRISSSNLPTIRKSLFDSKDFEKLKTAKLKGDQLMDLQNDKIKSMTLPLRSVSSNNKSLSPTAKLKNKLNFKKNSKSNLLNAESPKSKLNEKLLLKNDRSTSNKLADKLSNRLNCKMTNLADKLTDNINNNIVNNGKQLSYSKSFAYSSLNTISDLNNKFKYDDKISSLKEQNHVNDFNEYDRIIGPPVLAFRK